MIKTSLLAAVAALAAGTALCAEPDHPNEQALPRPAYLEQRPAEPYTLPEVAPDRAIVEHGTQTMMLKQVLFQGNTVVSTEDLQSVVAPLLGKSIGADDIETLRQKLTQLYVNRGYVNSGAVLTANAWNQGTLTFHIVEGRLKEIRLRGLERLNEHYVADRLARADEPLNILTLGERFQLLLTDPLFTRLNGQLVPDVERGKAILNVEVSRALPYQLTLMANNYRPVSIGAQSATLSGSVRNLTGYGDTFDASYQGPLGSGKASRTALGWRVPLNTLGTQATLNYDKGASSVIEQPIEPLNVESKLLNNDFGINQVLTESLRQKLSIGLNRVIRENSTTLLGLPFSFVPGEPTGTSKATDWRFWQEYAYRWETQVLALRSNFTFGKNNQVDDSTNPAAMPGRNFRVWLGQAQYARRVLDNGTQLILRLNVQASPDRLIAMEGMSVGGVYTVRGYRENQLVRDNGAVSNVEMDFPLLADNEHKLTLNLVPFIDYGVARNNGEDSAVLSSIGVATRVHWQGLAVDLAFAKRQHHSGTVIGSGSNLQDRGVHLQMSYNFF